MSPTLSKMEKNMKNRLITILLIAIMLIPSFSFSVFASENVLYVAPNGNDSAVGTIDAPLATLDGARQRVASLKAEGKTITEVIFRGGEYRLTKGVTFTSEDSGTTENPIVYRAYEGEKPVFKGSVLLDNSLAKAVTDTNTLARIHENAKGKVLEIDLLAAGLAKQDICDTTNTKVCFNDRLTDNGGYNTLFIDDKEVDISTWPNGNTYTKWDVIPSNVPSGEEGRIFHYTDAEPENWVNAPKCWWIAASPQYDFQYITIGVERIDTSADTITVVPNQIGQTFAVSGKHSQKWKAYNLLEEIDVPGEFSIDRDAMKLYFYPPYDITNAKIELSVLGKNSNADSTSYLVYVKQAENIEFRSLEFSQSRQNAVSTAEVRNVDFVNCTFKDIGGTAITNGNILSYWQEGGNVKTGFDPYPDHSVAYKLTTIESALISNDSSYDSDIRGCVFTSIGATAINYRGGNIDNLTKSGNIIEDNYITAANKRYPARSAVYLSGCGNIFRNNVVTHSSQNALQLNGSLHTVEKNELYDVMRDTGDYGAIYQGGSILYRGTEIKENYIHDIRPANPLIVSGAAGIYQDEGQQGNYIHNNIIVNAWIGYNSNWAGNIDFMDNTIVNCTRPWAFHEQWRFVGNKTTPANPMYTYALDYCINPRRAELGIEPLTMAEYIVTIPDESEEIYRETFPELFDWAEAEEPFIVNSMSVHSGNLVVGGGATKVANQEATLATWSRTDGKETDNFRVSATEEFVDDKNHNYVLKSEYFLANKLPGLLNDNNFSMDYIGLKDNAIVFNSVTSPYRLLSPIEGEQVSRSGLMLMWQEAFGANEYLVEIATDEAFTDIIFSETARYNHIDVPDNLPTGNTYYWRVTAVNTSKNQGTKWNSPNSTANFKLK